MLFHAFSWGPIVFQRLWGLRTYSNAKKSAERSTRALKFYTEKMWGAPARAIPVTSCERPELPIRVDVPQCSN